MTDTVLAPRWMEAADWSAVEAGYAHSFRDCRATGVWDWRFQRVPPAHAGWRGAVAVAPDGSIAAFVGGSCHRAWIHGRAATIMVGRDNYTAPAWRASASGRNGLFARTARLFFEGMPPDVAACVGIANARRVRLTERLGINHAYAGGGWYLWTAASGTSSGLACRVTPCNFSAPESGDGWDRLWQRRQLLQRAGLVRDRAFLSWRFDPRHGREYWSFALHSLAQPDPLGYLVLTPHGSDAAILVDAVLPLQPQVARDAWGQIAAWLAQRGISSVRTFMGAACPEAALLPGMGFRPDAPPLAVLPVFSAVQPWLDQPGFERDYVFTLADSDLF